MDFCRKEFIDCNAYVCFQIVSAVQYCHQKKIIHRDLKVSWILNLKYAQSALLSGRNAR